MRLVREDELESARCGVRGMIFDMDGTLIDSEKHHAHAFALAMREITGYVLSDDEKRRFKGDTTLSFSAELGRMHGFAVDGEAVRERKMQILRERYQPQFYPFARDFLAMWQGRVPLALATNSPRWFAGQALRHLGVAGWFDVVVTIDDATARKPDPQMVRLCARRLGLPPASILMFEDSDHGLRAALAAGCRAVYVDPEYPDRSRGSSGPFLWKELCRRLQPPPQRAPG